jgi:hypothetical protein
MSSIQVIETYMDAEILVRMLTAVPNSEVLKAYNGSVIRRDTRAMALCGAEMRKRCLLQ